MKLKCKSFCFQCCNPLEPYIRTHVIRNRLQFFRYRRVRPLFLENNAIYYKFFGINVKRVCFACFKNKPKYNPNIHFSRQSGTFKQDTTNKSKSTKEILFWFDGFLRYLKNQNKNSVYYG